MEPNPYSLRGYINRQHKQLHNKLVELQQYVEALEVADPSLQLLRQQILQLSLLVDELDTRLSIIEKHERLGLQIIRSLILAGFVVVLIVISRFI